MFATYSLTGNILTPTIAFTSFTLIETASWATSRMPDIISETVQVCVAEAAFILKKLKLK